MANKPQIQKGLSDKHLIAKYESGKFNLGKAVKSTFNSLNTTVKNQTKKK